jgi:hypothetical protein
VSQPTAVGTFPIFIDDEAKALASAQAELEQSAALLRDAFVFAVAGTFVATIAAALLS